MCHSDEQFGRCTREEGPGHRQQRPQWGSGVGREWIIWRGGFDWAADIGGDVVLSGAEGLPEQVDQLHTRLAAPLHCPEERHSVVLQKWAGKWLWLSWINQPSKSDHQGESRAAKSAADLRQCRVSNIITQLLGRKVRKMNVSKCKIGFVVLSQPRRRQLVLPVTTLPVLSECESFHSMR